ncbi:ABC transporter permease subunit [Fredinandcohnia sp. 179-A 10B2 NHS]|uniref:ABC transporter permease subunit n=1 Tax=Fredinandcohnia sp. 179-A 10B2 NHS TaxID=3235176 RepID=UPI00399F681E
MVNLLFRELKAYRKSLIIWSVGIVFLIVAGMSKYAGLESSGESMNELMAAMPKSLQAIMGTGTLDLSSPIGYYGVLYLYLLLMATIHATMLGATILAKEERDKTFEFLFVKPITRTTVITMKVVAAVINIVIFNVVTLLSSIFFVDFYGNGENVIEDILMLMGGMFILQILFLTIGTAIASVIRKPKKAASFSTGLLLLTFMLSVAVDLSEKLDVLKYITPFKYFDAKNMLNGEAFEPVYVMLSLLIIGILTVVTFAFYKKKDLNV